MANIVNRNGHRGIQFVSPAGKRVEVRLGQVNQKQAEAFCTKIESVLADLRQGRPHDAEVSDWLGKLSPKLIARMEQAGLVRGMSQRFVTLGEFLTRFMSEREGRVKSNTHIFYTHTCRCLLQHFGRDRVLRDISAEDAGRFRTYLENAASAKEAEKKLSPATVNRRVGAAHTLFEDARKRDLTARNPFEHVRAGESVNRSRQFFVTRETIDQVLAKCPDAQWRLLVCLARYGGVRVPSEVLSLKWEHVDFDRRTIAIQSPKTERHLGGDQRVIPLFPELLQPLLACREQAVEGDVYVITRYRSPTVNLRTQFEKIIQRAGVTPWKRLWQNLRSTRETELLQDFPLHAVCRWIGNTPKIAQKHYLQVTDADFARACATPPPPKNRRKNRRSNRRLRPETPSNARKSFF
jgi:integrase